MLGDYQKLGTSFLSKCVVTLLALAIPWLGCAGPPRWYYELPEDPRYLYYSSTAADDKMEEAIKKAEKNGREGIASQVSAKIKSEFKSIVEQIRKDESVKVLEVFQSVSEQVVEETLDECIKVKQKIDREDSTYRAYVLMRMDDPMGGQHYSGSKRSAVDDAVYKAVCDMTNSSKAVEPLAVMRISRSGTQDGTAFDLLNDRLISSNRFKMGVVNPQERKLIRWISKALGDDVDGKQAAGIGKELKIGSVIYGNIWKIERGKQRLRLKMIEVESTEFLWSRTIDGYPARSWKTALLCSSVPGIAGGQWYNFRRGTAIGLSLLEITGIISSVYLHGRYRDARDEYEVAQDKYRRANELSDIKSYGKEADRLYDDKKDWYNCRSRALGITTAIYLGRMYFAYRSAREYQQERQAR